ncbi:MAG: ATP-dependent Clp protease ATP-binding subunit ClpX [Flavobacteriales bacterium]|nr:ATP-dependent Clp protease ATP-binding subunit ClpX [Flavobacteriales bacterium]|tara:strand:- start:10442 stop:11692 length:1251 start_codon:yes stop_codon:yes gene_type:complete
MDKNNQVKCSFCGREKKDTSVLIAGIEGYICDSCVTQAQGIVKEESSAKININLDNELKLMKPIEIKKHLDHYVIGQNKAKKILSVAVYNHYKRLAQHNNIIGSDDDVEIEKSNILLVGETGTGKTLLARTIAKILNVPFCIADATVLTEAGYVGEDVEAILSRLLQAADYDVESAERGIVFIDEIDKIARKSDNPSISRDVSGEGVQQAMLKLLEGSTVGVPPQGGRKHPEQKLVQINTKNILFVCGGAFDGIQKLIEKRVKSQSLGFQASKTLASVDKTDLLQYVSPEDIKSFGLIPELIGRLPVFSHLKPLDRSALRRILTEPKNALVKQYVKLFDIDGIKLEFDKTVLDFIVDKALEYKLGARGLRSICESIMIDAMFDLPSNGEENQSFTITKEYAVAKLSGDTLKNLKVA